MPGGGVSYCHVAATHLLVSSPWLSSCLILCDKKVHMVFWATHDPFFFLLILLIASCAHMQAQASLGEGKSSRYDFRLYPFICSWQLLRLNWRWRYKSRGLPGALQTSGAPGQRRCCCLCACACMRQPVGAFLPSPPPPQVTSTQPVHSSTTESLQSPP